eukprot:scaffold71553_cov71-Phaeocystis_antarctica.AAC.1
MSSTTTDAAAEATLAAELAPDPNEVTAADKDAEMYASAPCTHPPSRCAALRAQLANDKETIEELTKQLRGAKVDSKHACVGLWTSKDKQTVRK